MKALPTVPNANLVTRPTGRAVRAAIEAELDGGGRRASASVIDLTGVRVLDFSCADEVVAGLLLRYLPADRPGDVFFLFRAVEEVHGHAVSEVLARHGLAAVCNFGGGGWRILGRATTEERAAWSALERKGRIGAGDSGTLLGAGGEELLLRLSERRLAYRDPAGRASALSDLAGPPAGGPVKGARHVGEDSPKGVSEAETNARQQGEDYES